MWLVNILCILNIVFCIKHRHELDRKHFEVNLRVSGGLLIILAIVGQVL